jgi:hypothetical protein
MRPLAVFVYYMMTFSFLKVFACKDYHTKVSPAIPLPYDLRSQQHDIDQFVY